MNSSKINSITRLSVSFYLLFYLIFSWPFLTNHQNFSECPPRRSTTLRKTEIRISFRLIRPGSFWRQNQEWKDQTTSTHHGERNLITITERTPTNLVCHFLDCWTIKSTFYFCFVLNLLNVFLRRTYNVSFSVLFYKQELVRTQWLIRLRELNINLAFNSYYILKMRFVSEKGQKGNIFNLTSYQVSRPPQAERVHRDSASSGERERRFLENALGSQRANSRTSITGRRKGKFH